MWGYYTTVVLVGIGFLTIGLGWTLLGMSLGLGLFFGFRNRTKLLKDFHLLRAWVPDFFARFRFLPFKKIQGKSSKAIQQTDRHWLFAEPKLSDIRSEGFEALSESFLLLKRLTPYHSAALFEYDAETRLAYPRIYSTDAEGFRKDALLSVSDGVVGYCLSSGKTVHYADFKGDARLLGYYTHQEEIRSVIAFPLDRADRRIGALVLDSKAPEAFAGKTEEIRHVANLLSELLVRVQREESLLVRLEEDRTLKAMTERMAKAGVSIREVAESICTLSKDVFPADRVTFVVFDEPSPLAIGNIANSLEPQSSAPIVRFRSLKALDRYVELVARTRKTIRLDDIWENGMMSLATGQAGLSTRSILAAPFVFESQVVGVVLLEADRKRAFSGFHETAVGELVSHAATAVVRAIEYGRMEKTCAIADVVPAAADRIFSEPSLEAAADLLKTRFGVVTQVFEVLDDKSGEIRLRNLEMPEAGPIAPSPVQQKAIESGAALARTDGKIIPVKEISGELPAGGEVAFPLASGVQAKRPFGILCLSLKSPLRAESIQILDRVRALIQIRLVLERRERQFGFLKVRDPLTGIFHTAAFEKKMDEQIRQSKESGTPFYLMLIQPSRLSALKRTHGFAETLRRYTSLCAEVERISGPRAVVGRIGAEDIGVIWTDGTDGLKSVRTQIERLSETYGFQIWTGSAEFPAGGDSKESLIETAAKLPIEVSAA